jgi:hypothetical protein
LPSGFFHTAATTTAALLTAGTSTSDTQDID